jgi:O-acetyl-ADP-ribose deacetylase (regulator of RNase III)
MRKMNHIFKGKHIGMPKIGAGLAGGDWKFIQQIIVRELKDCIVTVVIYKPE